MVNGNPVTVIRVTGMATAVYGHWERLATCTTVVRGVPRVVRGGTMPDWYYLAMTLLAMILLGHDTPGHDTPGLRYSWP